MVSLADSVWSKGGFSPDGLYPHRNLFSLRREGEKQTERGGEEGRDTERGEPRMREGGRAERTKRKNEKEGERVKRREQRREREGECDLMMWWQEAAV